MSTPEIESPELSPLEQVKQLAAATLSDQELSRLAIWARLDEPQRRKEAESAKQAAASATEDVVRQVWELQPSLKPDYTNTPEDAPDWVKPAGDLNSYPDGAHVTHQDQVWRNDLGTLNLAEPGVGPGWNDVTPIIADGTRDAPYQWAEGLELDGGDYTSHEGQLYIVVDDVVTKETPDQQIGQAYERVSG